MNQIITSVTELKNGKEIAKNIDKLEGAVVAALEAGGEHVKGKIAVYPVERHGEAIWSVDPEKRKKQLRGFFYHLKRGDIEVPYRRGISPNSQTLGRRWTIGEVVKRENGYELSVGNNASYGPFVQDREKQTRYHQLTGWVTTQDVVETEGPIITEMIGKAIEQEWEKRK